MFSTTNNCSNSMPYFGGFNSMDHSTNPYMDNINSDNDCAYHSFNNMSSSSNQFSSQQQQMYDPYMSNGYHSLNTVHINNNNSNYCNNYGHSSLNYLPSNTMDIPQQPTSLQPNPSSDFFSLNTWDNDSGCSGQPSPGAFSFTTSSSGNPSSPADSCASGGSSPSRHSYSMQGSPSGPSYSMQGSPMYSSHNSPDSGRGSYPGSPASSHQGGSSSSSSAGSSRERSPVDFDVRSTAGSRRGSQAGRQTGVDWDHLVKSVFREEVEEIVGDLINHQERITTV